jgi:predicted MFS family arabinose efflux permease
MVQKAGAPASGVESTARPAPGAMTLALGGLIALAAALGVGRFVYTPILPLMVEDLGMSQSAAGAIASMNFAGYLIGALLAASPALRGSRRRWMSGALAVSVVTTGAMGLVDSTLAFSILRFVSGVASAFVMVFASALVLDRLNAAGRAGLSALHFAGVGAGIAASAALVSVLAAAGGTWRMLWIASALLSLVCLALAAWLIPDAEEVARPVPTSHAGAQQALRRLVIAYGLVGFGYVITATFLVAIVRADAQLRSAEVYVWLLVGLSAAPSVAVWGRVARRVGNARAYAVACLMLAVGVAASVLSPGIAGIIVSALLLGGTLMGLTALGLIEARRLSLGDPRRTLAVMTASFGLGQIVGPTVAGVLHDATGSFLVPSLWAVGALLVAALLTLVPSHHAPA